MKFAKCNQFVSTVMRYTQEPFSRYECFTGSFWYMFSLLKDAVSKSRRMVLVLTMVKVITGQIYELEICVITSKCMLPMELRWCQSDRLEPHSEK